MGMKDDVGGYIDPFTELEPSIVQNLLPSGYSMSYCRPRSNLSGE